jgi:branched-chain amino acid transport system substrate-binding protein
MKLSKKRVLAAFGVLVAVAMVASGCSGGSSGGGASSSSSGGSSSGGTEVKIGIGAPLTKGAVALGQGMVRGAELAIDEANASETVKAAGIKFTAVPQDDQGDPTVGGNVAQTFASDPAVVGVMGHLNSGVSIPASKIYNRAKIVMISPASTNPALTLQGLNNVFRVCTTDEIQGKFAADAAYKDFGLKTAYVVDDSTPYGEGLAKYFAQYFQADGGKVIATAKTKDSDTDFSALVTTMKAANPGVIYYGGVYNAGALLAKQSKDNGMSAPTMGGDGIYDPQFIKLAGAKEAEGDLCTSVGYPMDKIPGGQAFLAAYGKKYPGQAPAAYDGYSYDAANVIIEAVLKAAKEVGVSNITGTTGRDAIIKDVAATNTQGVTGPIAFDSKGDTTNKVITAYQVKNGVWAAYQPK